MCSDGVPGPGFAPSLEEVRRKNSADRQRGRVCPQPRNIYGATKFAVAALAENTRLMVTPYEIGVTLIALGQPAGVDINTVVVRPTGSSR